MKLTLEQLTKLIEEYKNLDEACTAARKAGCLEIEGPLQNAIWSTIMWYILENEYGAKGYDAGYKGDMKPIKTPADLFQLMNKGTELESDNLKKELQNALCKVRELEMQVDNLRAGQY